MSLRTTSTTSIRRAFVQQLQTLANPERATQQQAYMKSSMPYAGVMASPLRTLCKGVFAAHPIDNAEQWHRTIADLWRNATVRETRYAAIELLLLDRYRKQWLTTDTLALIREMIETGAWWDFVDTLASNAVGDLLRRYPDEMFPELRCWVTDPNLWVRRTTILSQLKLKEKTDVNFLFEAIEGSIEDRDFFARKAIGWALRQHSRTAPELVIDYIERNKSRLSPLSKREGLKLLLKDGSIKHVP